MNVGTVSGLLPQPSARIMSGTQQHLINISCMNEQKDESIHLHFRVLSTLSQKVHV